MDLHIENYLHRLARRHLDDAETDGLLSAMRAHVADALAAEVPEDEILAGCAVIAELHGRVMSMTAV